MSKVNRYEYEGKVIEIPLRWDEHSKKEIEDYSLFIYRTVPDLHSGGASHSSDD